MKLPLTLLTLFIWSTTFSQVVKKVDAWVEQKRVDNEEWKKYNQIIPYHPHYDTMKIGLPMPGPFYDAASVAVLRDSFRITNPLIPLKIQALALQQEQVSYGYGSQGVTVGYGMMPFAGNFWEDISLGAYFEDTKKLLFKKLVRNRAAQTQLYNWVKPTIVAAFKSKPDTAQALDMFAVWKATQYLAQFDHARETVRTQSDYFTSTDWRGKPDYDAKIYAFWYRRITDFEKEKAGCSLADARYWAQIAAKDMWDNSKPLTKTLFNSWVKSWQEGKITHANLE